ncbi:MAG: hypothetical protein D6734_12360, partial [Candidatus Schekmanbacteria bacterium]
SVPINAPFQYDDQKVILKPSEIRTLNIVEIFWKNPFRFLLNLTFALNFFLTGLSPAGFRVFNILLHIENTVLFYFLFSRLENIFLKKEEDADFFSPANLSALLFALSPLMVESVTYISGRSELLCAFFLFLTLHFFLSFMEKANSFYLIPAVIFAASSLLSKERGGVLFFLIFLIIAIAPSKHRKTRIVYSLISFLLLFLFYFIFRQNYLGNTFETGFERDFKRQVLYQGDAQIKNLRLLLLPINLCVLYPNYFSSHYPFVRFFILIAIIIVSIFFTFWAIPKYKKMIFFCWSWFYILLAPNIIVPLQDIVADRWLYLPSAGFFYMIMLIICEGLKKNKFSYISKIAVSLVLLMMLSLSVDRNFVWLTEISLWQDAVKKAPASPRTYNNFGVALGKEGRLEEAVGNFLMSVSIDKNYSPAWANLGLASKKLGDEKGVLTAAASLLNCGNYYSQKGMIKEAIISYKSALDLVPDSIGAMGNLASIYMFIGKTDEARRYLKKLLEIAPSNKAAQNMLANIGE